MMNKALLVYELNQSNSSYGKGGAFTRMSTGLPLGMLITVCLLWMMQALVNNEHPLHIVDDPVPIPPIVMSGPPDIETLTEEAPVRPEQIQQPPQVVPFEPVDLTPDTTAPGLGPITIEKPPMSKGVAVTGQMIPFIKVPPQYPQAALTKSVEGYVDVMFDVTELGTTDNIRIVGFHPSSVFNRSVIKAIKNWKYKPNVVDGVPVRTPDVRDRVTFKMEK